MEKTTPMAATLIALRERAFTAEQRRRSILGEAVVRDVIPALHRGRRKPTSAPIAQEDVAALAGLCLAGQSHAVLDLVLSLHRQGVAAERLYLELLAPAAALLGCNWVDDICNFADVTVGLVHLQQALDALGPAFHSNATPAPGPGRRALLLPVPGEQHSFGLNMLADFFRRDRWSVWAGSMDDEQALRATIGREAVELVGLTVGCNDLIERTRSAIAVVRQASRNRDVVVMVGGPCFVADPDLAQRIGADGTASDGRLAVKRANALVRARRRE